MSFPSPSLSLLLSLKLILFLSRCLHVLRGHTSTVRCMRVLDGRPIAVSGSRDATLRVWNIETGQALHLLAGHEHSVRCIEISGNKVVSGSYDATCRVRYFTCSFRSGTYILIFNLIVVGCRYGRMPVRLQRTCPSDLCSRVRWDSSCDW